MNTKNRRKTFQYVLCFNTSYLVTKQLFFPCSNERIRWKGWRLGEATFLTLRSIKSRIINQILTETNGRFSVYHFDMLWMINKCLWYKVSESNRRQGSTSDPDNVSHTWLINVILRQITWRHETFPFISLTSFAGCIWIIRRVSVKTRYNMS